MVPVVGVDDAPTAALTTEANTLALSPILVPVSGSISVHKQPGSAGGRGLETPTTVSDHALLAIVVNNWSFSTCLWRAIVHCCPMS